MSAENEIDTAAGWKYSQHSRSFDFFFFRRAILLPSFHCFWFAVWWPHSGSPSGRKTQIQTYIQRVLLTSLFWSTTVRQFLSSRVRYNSYWRNFFICLLLAWCLLMVAEFGFETAAVSRRAAHHGVWSRYEFDCWGFNSSLLSSSLWALRHAEWVNRVQCCWIVVCPFLRFLETRMSDWLQVGKARRV